MEYKDTFKLTATGFALLAQIAHRPASAYDLTRLMRQNLHYLWPRAESRLYGEVSRLEAAGLIRGRSEKVGRRVRRIMSVTGKGRRALREWIAGDIASGIPLESEALLRVFFAAWGSVDDLRRALDQVRQDAEEVRRVALAVGTAYLANDAPAQQQAHVRSMIHELLSDYALLLLRWSSSQLKTTATWSNLDARGKKEHARKKFEASTRRLAAGAREN